MIWEDARKEGWIAAIALAFLLASPGAHAQGEAPRGADQKVTLNLRDVPLRAAIQMLFEGTGLDYAIDSAVPNVPITMTIRDVPFQSALRSLVRVASSLVPGLTFVHDGNLYLIRIREQQVSPPVNFDLEPPTEPATEPQTMVWEKIPLQHQNVLTLLPLFNGVLLPTEDMTLGGIGFSGIGGYGFPAGIGGYGLGGYGYGLGGLSAFGAFPGYGLGGWGLGGYGGYNYNTTGYGYGFAPGFGGFGGYPGGFGGGYWPGGYGGGLGSYGRFRGY